MVTFLKLMINQKARLKEHLLESIKAKKRIPQFLWSSGKLVTNVLPFAQNTASTDFKRENCCGLPWLWKQEQNLSALFPPKSKVCSNYIKPNALQNQNQNQISSEGNENSSRYPGNKPNNIKSKAALWNSFLPPPPPCQDQDRDQETRSKIQWLATTSTTLPSMLAASFSSWTTNNPTTTSHMSRFSWWSWRFGKYVNLLVHEWLSYLLAHGFQANQKEGRCSHFN